MGSVLILIYVASLSLYRLFLHPLRKFPGDKLAALTAWHWDYHASEQYYFEHLHNKYGPVVRFAPNMLHFSDPRAHSDIYSMVSKFTKDPAYYQSLGVDESSMALTDPKKAKIRRDIISPLFSRGAIRKLEWVVQDKVNILVSQILSHKDDPVDLYYAFRSTALDIITSYCFAQSWSTLTYPSFHHPILLGMDQALTVIWNLHAFPILHSLLLVMEPLIIRLNPNMKAFLDVRSKMASQVDNILRNPGLLDKVEHEVVYHHLMTPHPTKGQREVPSRTALWHESINLIFAGSDTVGVTTTVGTFHILNNKRVYATLVQELQEAWPDPDAKMDYETLEKLPYLTAVIKESLRIAVGVVSPMSRIVGPSSANIAGVEVPAGAAVSCSASFVHFNPDVFSDPKTFSPERWLQPNSRQLENSMVAFSRGRRSCPGVNLGWCELYLILGNVFRKIDMQLHNMSIDDFKYNAYILPVFSGNHLRVKAKQQVG